MRACVLESYSIPTMNRKALCTVVENAIQMLGWAERTMKSPVYIVLLSGCLCLCVYKMCCIPKIPAEVGGLMAMP